MNSRISRLTQAPPIQHTAAMTKPSAGQLLQQYIADHEENVASFAKAIGVGTASVYRWFDTHGPRSNVVRVVIEMRTKGEIKAEMWPMPGSRWSGTAKAGTAKKKIVKPVSKKKKIVKILESKKISKKRSLKRVAKRAVKPATKAKTPPTPPAAAT